MKLANKKVVCFVDRGFEDLEFWVPVMRLREAGAEVTIAGTGREEYTGKHGLKAEVDKNAAELEVENYDGAVIPGGWAPDRMRRSDSVLSFLQSLDEDGKIIATICHGGQVLISAELVEGRKATGTTAIKDDLENAGATWVDQPAFQEENLVWGRVVKDIPDFCRELVTSLAK